MENFRKDPIPGYEDEADFRKNYLKSVRKIVFAWVPGAFVSAQTGYAMEEFLELLVIWSSYGKEISTSALNKLIGQMWEHRPPASHWKAVQGILCGSGDTDLFDSLFCNREEKLNDTGVIWKRYPTTVWLIGLSIEIFSCRKGSPVQGRKI